MMGNSEVRAGLGRFARGLIVLWAGNIYHRNPGQQNLQWGIQGQFSIPVQPWPLGKVGKDLLLMWESLSLPLQ